MNGWIESHWLVLVAVVVLALLVAWWIWFRGGEPERERYEAPDVLTPGTAPAERNTLLMDAPSSAALASTAPFAGIAPDIMGGMGELIAAAAAREIDEAEHGETEHGEADDLAKIKGVGPKLIARLHELGVTRYAQIAAWEADDVARIDAALPPAFQGRIARDAWVEQARFLASGDVAGYEARFGKL